MRNRRRVVYYAILLLLILGELLGEINYIIIIFLEYDSSRELSKNSIEFSLSNADKGVVGLILALELAKSDSFAFSTHQ